MAIIYDAELTPSKPDLLTDWVPRQPWFVGDHGTRVRLLGSYRFDDPAGEVGIETFLVSFGDGPILQVPLTYRGRPLTVDGGEDPEPITTMQHSVLGERWVYDGPDDPAYVAALATAVVTGGTEARLTSVDGTEFPSRGAVQGSGSAAEPVPEPVRIAVLLEGGSTAITTELHRILLGRVIEQLDPDDADALRLTGTWASRTEPTVLAVVRPAADRFVT